MGHPPGLALTAAVYPARSREQPCRRPEQTPTPDRATASAPRASSSASAATSPTTGSLLAGYAYQDGRADQRRPRRRGQRLRSCRTTVSRCGTSYDSAASWGAGLGVLQPHRTCSRPRQRGALPGFTRVDAALSSTSTSNCGRSSTSRTCSTDVLRECAQQQQHHARLAAGILCDPVVGLLRHRLAAIYLGIDILR